VAVAQTVGYVLTINQVPQALAATMVGLSHTYGTWMFVALSVLIVVVLGAVLEGAPALILLAPLLLPVAIQLGFHPLHYGILLVIAMGIGLFSPPLGLGLYTCCAIGNVPLEGTIKSLRWYLGILLVGLIVLALIPQLTLALPRYFGY